MIFSRAFFSPLPPRRILATCVLAAILSASGCAQNNSAISPKNYSQSDSAVGSTPAGSTPNATWSEAFQKWWQALSQAKTPKKDSAGAAVVAPKTNAPTRNEIAAIAARHPAWKLADALAKNRAQPLQFEAISARSVQAESTLAAPRFDVNFPAASNTAENSNRNLPAPALSENESAGNEIENADDDFAAPVVIAINAQELREDARLRQEASIADFLRDAQMRQKNWQRDYRTVLQTALGEEIEVAQQRAPSPVALVLPSPELQLEMTNLRLQLLSNVFSTPTEREKASERLQELMNLWRAALAKQEKIRADELERLRVEEPARLRQAGLAKLETQLEIIRRAQQANRDAIAAEHRERVEADFGNENARLTLTLPPLSALGVLPAPTKAIFGSGQNQSSVLLEKIVFPRTQSAQRASVKGFSGIAASKTQTGSALDAQIRILRTMAWNDAKRQLKMEQRLKN